MRICGREYGYAAEDIKSLRYFIIIRMIIVTLLLFLLAKKKTGKDIIMKKPAERNDIFDDM